MKVQSMWQQLKRKTIRPIALAGAAVAIMAASPYAMAEAHDGGPGMTPQRLEQRQGQMIQRKMDFSRRLQAMVADGRVSRDQALKLQNLLSRHQKKQQENAREQRRFMESLPDKTGISEDTLRELFAPPQYPDGPRHRDRYDGHRYDD